MSSQYIESFATAKRSNIPNAETSIVADLFPEQQRENSATLIRLLEDYYDYLNTEGLPSYEIQRIIYEQDIDKTSLEYISNIQKEVAKTFPQSLSFDKVSFYKKIVEYYSARGTEDSANVFFKLFFDETINLFFPQSRLFRLSEGKWSIDEKALRDKITGYISERTLTSEDIGTTLDFVNRPELSHTSILFASAADADSHIQNDPEERWLDLSGNENHIHLKNGVHSRYSSQERAYIFNNGEATASNLTGVPYCKATVATASTDATIPIYGVGNGWASVVGQNVYKTGSDGNKVDTGLTVVSFNNSTGGTQADPYILTVSGSIVLSAGDFLEAGEITQHYGQIEKISYGGGKSIGELSAFSWMRTPVNGSTDGTNSTLNWALIDFDRSEVFNLYINGDGYLAFAGNNGGVGQIYSNLSGGHSTLFDISANGKTNSGDGTGSAGSVTGSFDTTYNVGDNQWHHVGVTYSVINQRIILWVDGVAAQVWNGTGLTDLGYNSVSNTFRSRRFGLIGDGSESGGGAENTFGSQSRNELYFKGSIGTIEMYEIEVCRNDTTIVKGDTNANVLANKNATKPADYPIKKKGSLTDFTLKETGQTLGISEVINLNNSLKAYYDFGISDSKKTSEAVVNDISQFKINDGLVSATHVTHNNNYLEFNPSADIAPLVVSDSVGGIYPHKTLEYDQEHTILSWIKKDNYKTNAGGATRYSCIAMYDNPRHGGSLELFVKQEDDGTCAIGRFAQDITTFNINDSNHSDVFKNQAKFSTASLVEDDKWHLVGIRGTHDGNGSVDVSVDGGNWETVFAGSASDKADKFLDFKPSGSQSIEFHGQKTRQMLEVPSLIVNSDFFATQTITYVMKFSISDVNDINRYAMTIPTARGDNLLSQRIISPFRGGGLATNTGGGIAYGNTGLVYHTSGEVLVRLLNFEDVVENKDYTIVLSVNWNTKTYQYWIDGASIASGSLPATRADGSALILGHLGNQTADRVNIGSEHMDAGNLDNRSELNGKISMIALDDGFWNDTKVKTHYNDPYRTDYYLNSQLVYHFDEGFSGNTITDKSSNGFHGNIVDITGLGLTFQERDLTYVQDLPYKTKDLSMSDSLSDKWEFSIGNIQGVNITPSFVTELSVSEVVDLTRAPTINDNDITLEGFWVYPNADGVYRRSTIDRSSSHNETARWYELRHGDDENGAGVFKYVTSSADSDWSGSRWEYRSRYGVVSMVDEGVTTVNNPPAITINYTNLSPSDVALFPVRALDGKTFTLQANGEWTSGPLTSNFAFIDQPELQRWLCYRPNMNNALESNYIATLSYAGSDSNTVKWFDPTTYNGATWQPSDSGYSNIAHALNDTLPQKTYGITFAASGGATYQDTTVYTSYENGWWGVPNWKSTNGSNDWARKMRDASHFVETSTGGDVSLTKTNFPFSGKINSTFLYNKRLTQPEVEAIYNQSKSVVESEVVRNLAQSQDVEITNYYDLYYEGQSHTDISSDTTSVKFEDLNGVSLVSPTFTAADVYGAGKYQNTQGFLSNTNKIQDSDYWQDFSYQVESGLTASLWQNEFLNLVHPAGLKLFASFVLKLYQSNTWDYDLIDKREKLQQAIKAAKVSGENINDLTNALKILEEQIEAFYKPPAGTSIYEYAAWIRSAPSGSYAIPVFQPGYLYRDFAVIEYLVSAFFTPITWSVADTSTKKYQENYWIQNGKNYITHVVMKFVHENLNTLQSRQFESFVNKELKFGVQEKIHNYGNSSLASLTLNDGVLDTAYNNNSFGGGISTAVTGSSNRDIAPYVRGEVTRTTSTPSGNYADSLQTIVATATADAAAGITRSTTLTVDNVSGTLVNGMGVSGAGVKNGTTITNVSGTTLTLNKINTINNNTALTFAGVYDNGSIDVEIVDIGLL